MGGGRLLIMPEEKVPMRKSSTRLRKKYMKNGVHISDKLIIYSRR